MEDGKGCSTAGCCLWCRYPVAPTTGTKSWSTSSTAGVQTIIPDACHQVLEVPLIQPDDARQCFRLRRSRTQARVVQIQKQLVNGKFYVFDHAPFSLRSVSSATLFPQPTYRWSLMAKPTTLPRPPPSRAATSTRSMQIRSTAAAPAPRQAGSVEPPAPAMESRMNTGLDLPALFAQATS